MKKDQSKVAGGVARAEALSPEKRSEIAKKAAIARWGAVATHRGSFMQDFGIDADCYVLNDDRKTAVIHQRGMAEAIGLSVRGDRLQRFASGKAITEYIGPELAEKIKNPIKFQTLNKAQKVVERVIHGYNVTILIDLCNAIIKASNSGVKMSDNVVRQAQIIISACAKKGITDLVYDLAGFERTKEEAIAAFKLFVQDEARQYEKEFPNELYEQWNRLYKLPVYQRGKPWEFKHLTVKHVYYPLAKSNGRLLDLIRALKDSAGKKGDKLFQFLNEIGARALRTHLGRLLEMTETSANNIEYEAKIVARFGGQQSLDLS